MFIALQWLLPHRPAPPAHRHTWMGHQNSQHPLHGVGLELDMAPRLWEQMGCALHLQIKTDRSHPGSDFFPISSA